MCAWLCAPSARSQVRCSAALPARFLPMAKRAASILQSRAWRPCKSQSIFVHKDTSTTVDGCPLHESRTANHDGRLDLRRKRSLSVITTEPLCRTRSGGRKPYFSDASVVARIGGLVVESLLAAFGREFLARSAQSVAPARADFSLCRALRAVNPQSKFHCARCFEFLVAAQPLMKARRSGFTMSGWVVHRPCGSLG